VLGFRIIGIGRGPVLIQCRAYLLIARCRRRRWLRLTVHFLALNFGDEPNALEKPDYTTVRRNFVISS
jgi:hypothetical protein